MSKRQRWPYGVDRQRQDALAAIRDTREGLKELSELIDKLKQHYAKTINDPLGQMMLSDALRLVADAETAQADAARFLVMARYGEQDE